MSMFNPYDQFGLMPEIPTPKEEPNEEEIGAAHFVGCMYAMAAMFILFLIMSIAILVIRFS